MNTPPTSYAIIGTGAVGGYYGARLQQAGCPVHFLARSDADHLGARGLVVESATAILTLPVHAYARPEAMPPCDVAVVALKSVDNGSLPRILPHVLKPGGMVLILQNGLAVEENAARVVGPDRVLGGLCFIAANKCGPGHIRHLGYGEILLGAYSPNGATLGITPWMQRLHADFTAAGVPVTLAENLALARWRKLIWNIPFNALSVILNADTQTLLKDHEVRRLIREIMEETRAMAAACGHIVEPGFIDKMFEVTDRLPPYLTSMKLDYDRGHRLELEAIYAAPLKAAAQAGAPPCPMVKTLHRILAFLEHHVRPV